MFCGYKAFNEDGDRTESKLTFILCNVSALKIHGNDCGCFMLLGMSSGVDWSWKMGETKSDLGSVKVQIFSLFCNYYFYCI